MKRIMQRFFSALLPVVLSGCFNTDLVAPPKQSVTLLPVDKPASYHNEYKNWYLFAGLLPIYTTQPEEIIQEENLVEVRVQTEDTVSDGIITFFTSLLFLGVFPQTVVVEGNPASATPVHGQPD